MFIVSLTIIYIYYNNNYETETPKNKRNIKNKDILLKDMFIVSLTIIYIYYNIVYFIVFIVSICNILLFVYKFFWTFNFN